VPERVGATEVTTPAEAGRRGESIGEKLLTLESRIKAGFNTRGSMRDLEVYSLISQAIGYQDALESASENTTPEGIRYCTAEAKKRLEHALRLLRAAQDDGK
jgi:hypothetical protein